MNLFDKDPDATYRAYQKFRKRNDYEKAYRCIETLLKQFPDDMELLGEIIRLALHQIKDPGLARPWLMRRIKRASYWRDYALLGEIEAASGSLKKAKESLVIATKLQRRQRLLDSPREVKQALDRVRDLIRRQEHNQLVQRLAFRNKDQSPAQDKGAQANPSAPALSGAAQRKPEPPPEKAEAHGAAPSPPVSYGVSMRVASPDFQAVSAMLQSSGTFRECRLRVEYAHLDVQRGFDDLLCLNEITGVERYWYQVETAKKVLKYFHGRVLLCDEVGLGKTVEAGIIMKEYLMRGMVKSILILTPAPLVSQWQEEMAQKFGIAFTTTENPLFDADPDRFWRGSLIIASIHTAKSNKNFAKVVGNSYDLVVVDEAHHLKNRNTLNWKLVNEIKKRFIFLLSATPVQNHLIELFNLITLLKPGQFKTERLFKQAYIQRGDSKKPANKEELRELLRDVMIRNTRSAIDLKLPRRFAATARLEPSAAERELYDGVTDFVRAHSNSLPGPLLQLLLREAGSSPGAFVAGAAEDRRGNVGRLSNEPGAQDEPGYPARSRLLPDPHRRTPPGAGKEAGGRRERENRR